MPYLKHKDGEQPRKRGFSKRAEPQAQPLPVLEDYKVSHVAEAIEGFARIFSRYVSDAREGEHGSSLFTAPNSHPVKIAFDGGDELTINLEGDAVDSIADSLKRIADVMSNRKEGT